MITKFKKRVNAVRKGVENGIVVNLEKNKLILSFSEQYVIDTNNKTVEQSIEVVKELMSLEQRNQLYKNKVKRELLSNSQGIKDPERGRNH